MSMIKAWADNWNNIIRNVIFEDDKLKELMCIDEDIDIITFVNKYFIKAGYATELLTDEPVRIVYSEIQGQAIQEHVSRSYLSFDIYVNTRYLHNATNDRLEYRTQLIANRLYELLTQNRYIEGFRFWIVNEYDLGTRTVGYSRYNLTVGYLKTY